MPRGPDSAAIPGIGTTIDLAALLDATEHTGGGTTSWVNPLDGLQEIVSIQRLVGDDAYVIVGHDWSDILAPYRLYAKQYVIFGSLHHFADSGCGRAAAEQHSAAPWLSSGSARRGRRDQPGHRYGRWTGAGAGDQSPSRRIAAYCRWTRPATCSTALPLWVTPTVAHPSIRSEPTAPFWKSTPTL